MWYMGNLVILANIYRHADALVELCLWSQASVIFCFIYYGLLHSVLSNEHQFPKLTKYTKILLCCWISIQWNWRYYYIMKMEVCSFTDHEETGDWLRPIVFQCKKHVNMAVNPRLRGKHIVLGEVNIVVTALRRNVRCVFGVYFKLWVTSVWLTSCSYVMLILKAVSFVDS